MGLETASADHACNVVRRQIQEEFPELTILFMVHQDGQRQKAFDAKRGELREHPAAEAFLPTLKQAIEQGGPEFSGISIKQKKKLTGFLSKEKILACFFVNASRLDSSDDVKRHALYLAWQALALIEDYKNQRTAFFVEHDGVVLPVRDQKIARWKSMLSDTFSVLVLEMDRKRDSIGTLGRLRSTLALTARVASRPEEYPFPLVLDATRLVYHDMARVTTGSSIRRALEMTREIGETFDPPSVQQWQSFCKPAQELAWLNAEQNTILGAAVFGSDDPHARATAYLVAEALNIQTINPAPPGIYNPFSDAEVNERHHLKACEENFTHLVSKIAAGDTFAIFKDEIARQNQKLLSGNPLGWCVHALKQSEAAFRDSKTLEDISTVFHAGLNEAPWQHVSNLLHLIVMMRRDGIDVTPEILFTKLQDHEELKSLAPCFQP